MCRKFHPCERNFIHGSKNRHQEKRASQPARCDIYPGNRHYTVAVTDLRQAYHIWCAEEGLEPVKGRAFASQLKVHGVLVGRDAPPQPNSGARVYGGIQLKDSDIW